MPLLPDNTEIPITSRDHSWMVSWHSPDALPDGRRHGSAGICVTSEKQIVLISTDNQSWDFPAGRPEGEETWEQTLTREVMEEACSIVSSSRLLGFTRGYRTEGPKAGIPLVRAIFLAEVELLPWKPKFEIKYRHIVSATEARGKVLPEYKQIWDRAFFAAGLT